MWRNIRTPLAAVAVALGLLGVVPGVTSACHLCGHAHHSAPLVLAYPTVAPAPVQYLMVTTQPATQNPSPATPGTNPAAQPVTPLPPYPSDFSGPKATQPNPDQQAPPAESRKKVRDFSPDDKDFSAPPPQKPPGTSSIDIDDELGQLQSRMMTLIYRKRLMEAAAEVEKSGAPVEEVLRKLDAALAKDMKVLKESPIGATIDASKIEAFQKPQFAKLLRDVAVSLK